MVERYFGSGPLLRELELRNRVNARIPADLSPSLDDALARYKFDVSSHDMAAEKQERASHFTTDLRGLASRGHGLHDSTELYDLVELFGVGERFVDARPARFENRLLVNGFCRTRKLLLGSPPGLVPRVQSQHRCSLAAAWAHWPALPDSFYRSSSSSRILTFNRLRIRAP